MGFTLGAVLASLLIVQHENIWFQREKKGNTQIEAICLLDVICLIPSLTLLGFLNFFLLDKI